MPMVLVAVFSLLGLNRLLPTTYTDKKCQVYSIHLKYIRMF